MSRPRVLVVGDAMLDGWLHGQMTRVSPEAATPVILNTSTTYTGGGAAHVAVSLSKLGCETFLVGIAGNDTYRGLLLDLLGREGVMANLLPICEVSTITKFRVLSDEKQVLRIDTEDPTREYLDEHRAEVQKAIEALFQPNLPPIDAIVIADYGKGVFSAVLADWLVGIGRYAKIPVFVDTKPGHQAWFRHATVLKPNYGEAKRMCDNSVSPVFELGDEEDQTQTMCEWLHKQYGYGVVVITRGGKGASCYNGTDFFTSSVLPVEVYDVAGAGDTFMAAMVESYLRGEDLPGAVLRANTAASVAVSHHGTYAIDRWELHEATIERHGPEGKIMYLPNMLEWLDWKRSQGKRVVVTNGCYRLLHHGHLSTFAWAKHQGDVLVVAMNSDDSIEQLKGSRPAIPWADRALMIAQQPCVDAVINFDDTNVEQTIRAIKPDVLVKGAQYQEEKVPGADYVAGYGGAVRFAPMVEGISSTILEQSLDKS